MRNFGDGADIGGHILAFAAIAARRGLDQHTVFIAERARQPIDLRLRRHQQGIVLLEPQKLADARAEFGDLVIGENIAERQHGDRMPHLGEFLRRSRSDRLSRGLRADKFGVRLFEGNEGPGAACHIRPSLMTGASSP